MEKCKQFGGRCGNIACFCNRKCERVCCDTCEWGIDKCCFPLNNPSRYSGEYRKDEITADHYLLEKEVQEAISNMYKRERERI